ncbi:MAG TPA: hypothetical protein VJB99_00585 [Patescibacteria group bacterium]|nr:hypothetical protein [Patescibacteria group bacterium]
MTIPKTRSLGLPEEALPLSTGESRFEEWAKGAKLRETLFSVVPLTEENLGSSSLTAEELKNLRKHSGSKSSWKDYVEQRWALLAGFLMGDDAYAQLHIGGVFLDEDESLVTPWRNSVGPHLFIPVSWIELDHHPDRQFEVLQLICGRQLVRRWTRTGVRFEQIGLSQVGNFPKLWKKPFEQLAPWADRAADALGYFLALYLVPARVENQKVLIPDSMDWIEVRLGLVEKIVRIFAQDGQTFDAPAYAWEAHRLVTLWDDFPKVGGKEEGEDLTRVFPLKIIQRWERSNNGRPGDSLVGVLSLVESVVYGQPTARRWTTKFGLELTDEEWQLLQGLPTPWNAMQLLGAVSIWRRIRERNETLEGIFRDAFSWVFRLLDTVPWQEPLKTTEVGSFLRWEPPKIQQMLGLGEPVIRLMAGELSVAD